MSTMSESDLGEFVQLVAFLVCSNKKQQAQLTYIARAAESLLFSISIIFLTNCTVQLL